MDPALSLVANRLRGTLRSCLRFSEISLPTMRSSSRSYSTEKASSRWSLSSTIFPLASPSVSILPELDRWMEKTKNVRAWEVQHVVRELRKRNRYMQALEVSEWMKKKVISSFMPSDHAVQLDLIGRVHGLASAETYFNSMGEESKTDKTYGALLNCYVRERQTEKSLSHMEKMKKMGFASTALTYNDIMSLYTNTGQHNKVLAVLDEMKENGVFPDNFSYRICINSYGARSDIAGMEKLLEEMEQQPHIVVDWNTYAVVAHNYIKGGLKNEAMDALKKSEEKIEKRSGLCYNHLISLYGHLKDKSQMMRLWKLQKLNCKKFMNRDYTTMLGALVKLGEFEEAETLLKDWESSGNVFNFRVPNVLLVGYRENGLVEKAEVMLEDFVKRGKTPTANSWGIVATGFGEKGELKKAHQYMEKALCSYAHNAGWRPNTTMVASILRWLRDEAEVKTVETFVELLKFAMPVDRNMYHALIKANIRAGKEVGEVVKSMKVDGIEEDDETKEILKLQGSKD